MLRHGSKRERMGEQRTENGVIDRNDGRKAIRAAVLYS